MATSKARKLIKVRTAAEFGHALGLSASDTAEMKFRSDLTVSLTKIIQAGQLTHADIAKRAGTSRTRVTAIANGNTQGVSTDVLIRVLAVIGHQTEIRVKKTAASLVGSQFSSPLLKRLQIPLFLPRTGPILCFSRTSPLL